ncbi:MAG: hypothetical protein IFNCLDLE_02690 [Ignavibacteriaceae bacterium]|nr:hypothetical protein [Ignavibacteriaceae bacterium]
MGLDMYLSKRTYIGNNYRETDEQTQVILKAPKKKQSFVDDVSKVKQGRVSEIVERMGYWRKANQIHNWFVQNVQDGNDDCGEHYVSNEQLRELLDLVNKVLASCELVKSRETVKEIGEDNKLVERTIKVVKDSKIAEELLPTTSGFFFGGTGYDEFYVQDLEDTKKILEAALAESGDYYYHSSW